MSRECTTALDVGRSGDELLWCGVEGSGVKWSEVEGSGGMKSTGRRGSSHQGCSRNAAWRGTLAIQVMNCCGVGWRGVGWSGVKQRGGVGWSGICWPEKVRRPRMSRESSMAVDVGCSGDELLWCGVEGSEVEWSEVEGWGGVE